MARQASQASIELILRSGLHAKKSRCDYVARQLSPQTQLTIIGH
jgi:hypothetical protein